MSTSMLVDKRSSVPWGGGAPKKQRELMQCEELHINQAPRCGARTGQAANKRLIQLLPGKKGEPVARLLRVAGDRDPGENARPSNVYFYGCQIC